MRLANWWLLFPAPLVVSLFFLLGRKRGLHFSSVGLLRGARGAGTRKHKIGKTLIMVGTILAFAALARPQTTDSTDFQARQGIDIVMVLDVSGSMQSVDIQPNRLEVARDTIDDFVSQRANDRISLVVFAGEAYTRIPLTLDHGVVRESLANVSIESVNTDGTAIGTAISVGINRLKKSDASSRIMILVTDGDNNAGAIDPQTAGALALEMGIKIYAIGIGSDMLILPVQGFGGTQYQQVEGGFDEELLMKISEATGGQYFRAADADTLERVFDTINQLERTDFQDDNFQEYNELAFPLLMAAIALLILGIFLDRFVFLQVP